MRPSLAQTAEHLYRIVYALEGVRNPIANQAGLDRAADNLRDQMASVGLAVREQVFYLEGYPTPFRNIEGSLGPVDDQPAVVLMAHYDTVDVSPGANDNAAGCAVLVEVGRILAEMDDPPPVYFVAVALEESKSNPLIYGQEQQSALKQGVIRPNGQFTHWANAKLRKAVETRAIALYESGMSQGEGYRTALTELDSEMTPELRQHIEEIIPLYDDITVESSIGRRSRIGSHRWLQDAQTKGKTIAYNITIDEPGIYFDEAFSQGLLGKYGFEVFTHRYGLDEANRVGNFVFIATNHNSGDIGRVFSEQCLAPEIDLPYGWVDVPLTFAQVAESLPQGLGSDHAAFWQANIPAMFLFDSSNARDPWVHTPADTIDKINFDRLASLTHAVSATIADQDLRSLYGVGKEKT